MSAAMTPMKTVKKFSVRLRLESKEGKSGKGQISRERHQGEQQGVIRPQKAEREMDGGVKGEGARIDAGCDGARKTPL